MMTYQLTVVCSQIIGVGVGEEQQLGVGVDGDVGLDDGLVPADEVGDILDLNLRLGTVPTESVTAGVTGSSKGCKEKDVEERRIDCTHEVQFTCHEEYHTASKLRLLWCSTESSKVAENNSDDVIRVTSFSLIIERLCNKSEVWSLKDVVI